MAGRSLTGVSAGSIWTWLPRRLAEPDDHEHHRLLRQFGLLHQLPKLRAIAGHRTLTPATRNRAAEQFTHAGRFLLWLDQHGRRLDACTQADLDAWHAQARVHQQRALRSFLTWAMQARYLPKLTLPTLTWQSREPVTQARRLSLLRTILDDDRAPLRSRVAACLLLLYAQPASRIVRLTTDDIQQEGDQVLLRLGEPPVPVPEPFAVLLLQLAAQRDNMNSAANPSLSAAVDTRRFRCLNVHRVGPFVRGVDHCEPATVGRAYPWVDGATAATSSPLAVAAGTDPIPRVGLPRRHRGVELSELQGESP